ncbi:Protein of unknown function [Gryllus bimaculatus]|nr:Protein of unknown function [Gryllus bimaculatus]
MFNDSTGALGAACAEPPWGGAYGPAGYPPFSPLQPPASYGYPGDLTGPVAVPAPPPPLEPAAMSHLPTVLSEHSTNTPSGPNDYGSMFSKSSPGGGGGGPADLDGMLGGGHPHHAPHHAAHHHRYPADPVPTYSTTECVFAAPGLGCGGTTYHAGAWSAPPAPPAPARGFPHAPAQLKTTNALRPGGGGGGGGAAAEGGRVGAAAARAACRPPAEPAPAAAPTSTRRWCCTRTSTPPFPLTGFSTTTPECPNRHQPGTKTRHPPRGHPCTRSTNRSTSPRLHHRRRCRPMTWPSVATRTGKRTPTFGGRTEPTPALYQLITRTIPQPPAMQRPGLFLLVQIVYAT